MFILYFVIIGITLGYIRGGRIAHLITSPMHNTWLVFSALLIQLVLFSNFPYVKLLSSTMITTFHMLSYICLLLFIILNRKISGILIIGLGSLLNSLTIFLNGGYMPSMSVTSIHNNVAQVSKETLLPWLGDVFHLPMWIPLANGFSVGDVFIAVGVCIYLIVNMSPSKQKNSPVY